MNVMLGWDEGLELYISELASYGQNMGIIWAEHGHHMGRTWA